MIINYSILVCRVPIQVRRTFKCKKIIQVLKIIFKIIHILFRPLSLSYIDNHGWLNNSYCYIILCVSSLCYYNNVYIAHNIILLSHVSDYAHVTSPVKHIIIISANVAVSMSFVMAAATQSHTIYYQVDIIRVMYLFSCERWVYCLFLLYAARQSTSVALVLYYTKNLKKKIIKSHGYNVHRTPRVVQIVAK